MDYIKLAQEILNKGYNHYGVRSIYEDEKYSIGDYCRDSYEWDFERDCSTYDVSGEDGEKAGGTCATKINVDYFKTEDEITELAERIQKAVEFNESYYGDQIIIAGDYHNGNCYLDENEIRIIDAVVIAKL